MQLVSMLLKIATVAMYSSGIAFSATAIVAVFTVQMLIASVFLAIHALLTFLAVLTFLFLGVTCWADCLLQEKRKEQARRRNCRIDVM